MRKITIFRRHSTDGALFVQRLFDSLRYVRMKNSVLTYFEKAVTKHKGRCWNRETMYGSMTYVYIREITGITVYRDA